jgi:hypothetical protein
MHINLQKDINIELITPDSNIHFHVFLIFIHKMVDSIPLHNTTAFIKMN